MVTLFLSLSILRWKSFLSWRHPFVCWKIVFMPSLRSSNTLSMYFGLTCHIFYVSLWFVLLYERHFAIQILWQGMSVKKVTNLSLVNYLFILIPKKFSRSLVTSLQCLLCTHCLVYLVLYCLLKFEGIYWPVIWLKQESAFLVFICSMINIINAVMCVTSHHHIYGYHHLRPSSLNSIPKMCGHFPVHFS